MAGSRTAIAAWLERPRLQWALGALMVLAILFLLLQLWFFCKVVWYNLQAPSSTPIMRAAIAEMKKSRPDATLKYQWADYDAISSALKRAVVASEDSGFMRHGGVEWEAIRNAWQHNRALAAKIAAAQESGEPVRGTMRGGSTITQQLAKNLFLSNSRSYLRKGQELIIAWMIEHVMSKQRILELYLNVAEWGEGVFGAQAAARHHFGVDASRLSQRQAAQLAARLPNPRFYDARGVTRYLNSRTSTVLARMRHADIP